MVKGKLWADGFGDKGFTLLEILLVLVFMAGAGFVLLIKLPVHLERDRLDLAATQLLGDVRDVRQAALAENDWYQIKFYRSVGDHYYQVFREGTRVKEVHFDDGIQFKGQPTNLLFNASGRSAGATIELINSAGEEKSIVVAPVGMRIREK
jgi:prepilin-type N-terminal cleavage/methylation domain-containing protein